MIDLRLWIAGWRGERGGGGRGAGAARHNLAWYGVNGHGLVDVHCMNNIDHELRTVIPNCWYSYHEEKLHWTTWTSKHCGTTRLPVYWLWSIQISRLANSLRH